MSIDQTQAGTNGAAMGTRILLVEDDPSTQDLIRALCEGRGDTIDTAADGFLGLRLLSERRHAIVLIDYHLPEMDGYALARLMRELARPDGRVRLVGITADRHGLASRRGADTLFDAILVKPLDPQTLFAMLDRLMQPEPAAVVEDAGDPAGALWHRRGLSGRPRAILCPPPSAAEAEAVAQAFTLAESPSDADIVLLSDEAGLDGLRALRADGPAALLPAYDLTGRLGAACDGVFQVGDPDSWTALARTSLAFAKRRGTLASRTPLQPKMRLAALMHVADRGLRLAAGDEPPGTVYATGLSKTALMAAALELMEDGALSCEPVAGGVAAALTQVGRDAVLHRAIAESALHVWQAPAVHEAASDACVANTDKLDRTFDPASEFALDMPVNLERLRQLNDLVGSRQIEALLTRLSEMIDEAFAPNSDTQTIARQAHTLISTAGSLGFEHLSQTCLALQDTIAAGADETRCLRDAKIASQRSKALCVRSKDLLDLIHA